MNENQAMFSAVHSSTANRTAATSSMLNGWTDHQKANEMGLYVRDYLGHSNLLIHL